jgi:hypothetical protein
MKTVSKILLFMVVLVGVLPCGSAQAVEGMVSYWRFDEGTGTMAYDSVGDNHGTVYGATWTSGIVAGALSFDGVDDYVEIPHSPSLDITGAITMSGWIKLNSLSGGNMMLAKAVSHGHYSRTSYMLLVGSDAEIGLKISLVLFGYWPADLFVTTSSVNTGEWYHLAATWDGSTSNANNVKIYINGELNQSFTKTNTLRSVTESVTIGSMKPSTYYNALDGYLDEVAIYNRALSEQEIEECYLEAFDLKTIAIGKIEQAIAEKLEALERIDAAIEKEWAAIDALDELLASGDYGDLNKADILRAKQNIFAAIQQQEPSKNMLEQSLQKLEDSLRLLGAEWQP